MRNALKDVINISMPAVGEIILYNFISLIDIVLLGNFGGKHIVASAGICNELIFTFSNIFITAGIAIGITSIIARNVGGGRYEFSELYATLGFKLGTYISVMICFVFYFFSKDILIFSGVRKEILDISNQYLKLCTISMFFFMLSNLFSAILRGYGNTYVPFLVASLIVSINILLDVILIFGKLGFKPYGILGAGIAKVIAQIIGFTYLMIYFFEKSKVKIKIKHTFLFHLNEIRELLAFSVPSSMEEAVISISMLLSNIMIMYSGTTFFAANQLANTVERISIMPGIGFSVAATALVGFRVGEKKFKEARNYAKICVILGISIMVIFSFVFFIFPNTLISHFINTNEKDVIFWGTQCLKIGTFEQLGLAISIIYTGAMKGFGDAETPMFISTFCSLGIRLPLMFYSIYIMKFPVTYVWYITAFQWSCDAVLTYYFYKKKCYKI